MTDTKEVGRSKSVSKNSVLFVCLGNICRSPAAEAIFKAILASQGLEKIVRVDSAGTSSDHIGETADQRMRQEAHKRSLYIDSIARQFTENDFESFDFIVVMDDSNKEKVLSLSFTEEQKYKVKKMTDYCCEKFSDFSSVPDPYYGGQQGFSLVLDILEDACFYFFEKEIRPS